MMSSRHIALIVALGLVIWLAWPTFGQPLRYPTFDVSSPEASEYRQALAMKTSERTEAIALLKDIGARHPRSSLGAVSLFQAATLSRALSDKQAIYRQISQEYSQSRFDIFARNALINLEMATVPHDFENHMLKLDQLSQSFGAPRLRTILSGSAQASNLSEEFQDGLDEVYDEIGGCLEHLGRNQDALELAFFQRDNLLNNTGAADRISYLLVIQRFGHWAPYQSQPDRDPKVEILRPKAGHSTGPRPKVVWETSVGDWRFRQVDVQAMTVTLDGKDVKSLVRWRSRTNARMSTKPNAIFERIHFSFRPATRLSSGAHQLVIVVPVEGYTGTGPGKTESRLNFYVGRDPDDDDDDSDEPRLPHCYQDDN